MNSTPPTTDGITAPAGVAAQKYSDDMMIIPVDHYMKDPELRQDVADLMSGEMFKSSCARSKLGRKGYSDVFLEKMQNAGWRWKYMQPPHGLQFGLVPAGEEIVSMIPEITFGGQRATPNASYASMMSATAKKAPDNHPFFMPLASLGLSIVSMGSDMFVQIKDADALKHALRQAQFAKNVFGKRAIWQMRMTSGRAIIDPNTARMANLSKQVKTLQWVKIGGKFSVGGSIIISGVTAASENTAKAWTKFGLDVVMVGVAYIPVVGWVISGIYFITDAALSLGGVDWWSVVWDNVIAPSDAMTKEKIAMLDTLALALH